MNSRRGFWVAATFAATMAAWAAPASAEPLDAGGPVDAGDDVPLACDGGLCDTTNDATCAVFAVGASGRGAPVVALAVVVVGLGRRRREHCR